MEQIFWLLHYLEDMVSLTVIVMPPAVLVVIVWFLFFFCSSNHACYPPPPFQPSCVNVSRTTTVRLVAFFVTEITRALYMVGARTKGLAIAIRITLEVIAA
eukprot:TRINITY_DN318_c0_g1_i8.p1 TRINITY_DN318_c0_g1~~TRINITY_DN318_c0_g1_i8.p1  ORF type:complete len:101 (-),score=3.25 TRINITY_DN318_c0_g1_i8:495-797(-)